MDDDDEFDDGGWDWDGIFLANDDDDDDGGGGWRPGFIESCKLTFDNDGWTWDENDDDDDDGGTGIFDEEIGGGGIPDKFEPPPVELFGNDDVDGGGCVYGEFIGNVPGNVGTCCGALYWPLLPPPPLPVWLFWFPFFFGDSINFE